MTGLPTWSDGPSWHEPKFFAGAGLLSCHARKRQPDQFYGVVRRLLALAADGVPEICAEDLVAALQACPSDLANEEVEQLLDMARAGLESP